MRGALHPPSDVYVRTFFCPLSYLNKTLLYKSFWLIRPGPWSWSWIFFGDHESNTVHHKLLICALPIWLTPGSCVFTSWVSSGITLESGCSLGQVFFSFPSVLRAHWLMLAGWDYWWLRHPCLLIGQEIFHSSPSCHCYSVVKSCLTLCEPRNCSTPGFPVLHSLPEFAQTHVHWVGDAIQTSHPLLTSFPPVPFPSMSLFQWDGSSHQVAKVLELQLQHQSFQWIFRVDFL